MNKIAAVAGVVLKELFRRKDFYVLFIITVLISSIMLSVNIFNDDKVIRYLKELCLLLIWISTLVMTVTTAARQIPSERESRTLFPLLAKPITRWQVLVGKFFGCWLAAGGALLLFYIFFALLAYNRERTLPIVNYVQAIGLHWMLLGVLTALTLLGSLVFAAPSSNVTICFVVAGGILLIGRHLNKVALQMTEPGRSIVYSVYYLIPHLELFDVRDLLIHNWPAIAWGPWSLAILYGLFFSALFLWAGCWVFERKAVN
jgi:ABC-type transport system involved in multi-copper enzyme maturation permease subunit